MAERPLLVFRQITKSFGVVRALRGVDLEVRAGEVHALLGENGAGKSTLIKVATGAHAPDSGVIELAGERLERLDPALARRRGIACIYQQPALFPELSVAENLALRLEPAAGWRRVVWSERRRMAAALLARIGAEIASAMGAGARVVIMDEPTASLTRREQERLFGIVSALRSEGVAVIYISHRLEEILTLADRVTVLRDGQTVACRTRAEVDEATLIRLMVGREVDQLYPGPESAPGAVRLELKGLCCRAAGGRPVSLQVRAGEVYGLAGLVGAGRTELARTIFGLTPADAGEVRIDGVAVTIGSPQAAIAQGVAYVPEDRRRHGVVLELPVGQNISLAAWRRIFPRGWLRRGRERSEAEHFVRALSIKTPDTETAAANLSGGNQQKVALARWLATRPRVLLLDEPTQGVDVGAKSEIHRLVRRFAAEGMAVLLISSDLPEVLGMSDRIGVMRGGELVAELPQGATATQVMGAALGQAHEEGAA
jgi:rhamnose transport system ATP-binding protein